MLFDNWYTSLEKLKAVRANVWLWLSQLESNRLVNPDGKGNVPVQSLEIPAPGRQVHLRGYGFIEVFRIVSQACPEPGRRDGDVEYWATNELTMTPE